MPGCPHKAGVTLVELLVSSAVLGISVISLLVGFTAAERVSHANAEALRADNVAFDLLWRRFNLDYDQLPSTVGQRVVEQNTTDAASPYRSNRLAQPPAYSYTEYTEPSNNVKYLTIELRYGPNNQYTRRLQVVRSEIPRTNPALAPQSTD